MNFFFDRNLSEHLARIVASFDRDNQVVHQDRDSRFEPTTPDVELIAMLAADSPRPVFVTADVAQRRRPEERRALAASGMCVVFSAAGSTISLSSTRR